MDFFHTMLLWAVSLVVLGMLLGWMLTLLWARKPIRRGRWDHYIEVKPKECDVAYEIELTNEQLAVVKLAPKTTTGKPALIDESGELMVTVVSGEGTFEILDDYTCKLISPDTPGDTSYLIEADADLGAGVEPLTEAVILHVSGAKAAFLGLSHTVENK